VRILHVDTGRAMRGGQHQALYLIRGLAERGHACTLLAPGGSALARAASDQGIDVRPLTLPALWRLSRSCDAVHAHSGRAHTLAAVAGAERLVVSRRVAFPVKRGPLSRWKYSRAAHFLAVSDYVKRTLLAAGVAPERVSVVYDGVPLLEPSRLARRVIAPATSDPRKGSSLARRAAARAGVDLYFSGDLMRDLDEARLFVYVTHEEGLGSAALLAMAAAVPVVASRVGGLPEAVEHGVTGLLVENSVEAIASAIRSLLEDRETAAAYGRRGRQRVEERFTIARMVEETERVYRRLVE
jgi:glycosyltransferase involved in cell wall biosynthesis